MDDGATVSFLGEFENVTIEPTPKRSLCDVCRRPTSVCWCRYLPKEPIAIRCTVLVLQHPTEVKQCLRTAPILVAGLPEGKCHIIRGRKFSPTKNICQIEGNDTILLYPGQNAIDISELPPISRTGRPYTILMIDGTWSQAKSLYHNSPYLHQIQQVKITPSDRSKYVIKTQPSEGCLSTVESVAFALSILEENPSINEVLLQPLYALCSFQIQHGAVEHRSKEFHIINGSYSKPLPRKLKRRVNKILETRNVTCLTENRL